MMSKARELGSCLRSQKAGQRGVKQPQVLRLVSTQNRRLLGGSVGDWWNGQRPVIKPCPVDFSPLVSGAR